MENHVVETIVAVRERIARILRNIFRQPLDQIFHRFDFFGLRGAILFDPTRDLPLDVISRLAEIGKAHLSRIDGMQRSDSAIQFAIVRAPLLESHVGKIRIPK